MAGAKREFAYLRMNGRSGVMSVTKAISRIIHRSFTAGPCEAYMSFWRRR